MRHQWAAVAALAAVFAEAGCSDNVTGPDEELVRNIYGVVGQLVAVEQDASSGPSIYVSDIDYDIFGRVDATQKVETAGDDRQ